ncbi:TPA: acylphosphatase [Legionella feeleii]|nr:acylphosphatase [Legionella feeleii]
MMEQFAMHCYVSGKVQGVWFRASTKSEADRLGLKGWVRNLSDGRVEVFACGNENQLELFYAWLQQGPRFADVSECTRENLPWEDHPAFEILR